MTSASGGQSRSTLLNTRARKHEDGWMPRQSSGHSLRTFGQGRFQTLRMLVFEAFVADHRQHFLHIRPVAPVGAEVCKANPAFGVDNDGARSVDVFGVHSKGHRVDAVARADVVGAIKQVRPLFFWTKLTH